MQIGKKGLVAIALTFAILVSALAYALLTVQHQYGATSESHGEIPSTTVVGELGVKVYQWAEGETLGALKTSHDWGMVLIGEARIKPSELLVIKNIGDEPIKIKYDEDLPDNLGLIPMWQIEVCVDSWVGGRTYAWANVSKDGKFAYKYGDQYGWGVLPNLGVGQCFGFQPPLGSERKIDEHPEDIKAYGHLRMVLVSTANPTKGSYSFTMTVIGEEIP